MLSEGLKATLVDTGSRDNVVIIRRGAETEVQSGIDREQAALLETYPEVAVSPRGRPAVSLAAAQLISADEKHPRLLVKVHHTFFDGDSADE